MLGTILLGRSTDTGMKHPLTSAELHRVQKERDGTARRRTRQTSRPMYQAQALPLSRPRAYYLILCPEDSLPAKPAFIRLIYPFGCGIDFLSLFVERFKGQLESLQPL